jgi:hypothetical protein
LQIAEFRRGRRQGHSLGSDSVGKLRTEAKNDGLRFGVNRGDIGLALESDALEGLRVVIV